MKTRYKRHFLTVLILSSLFLFSCAGTGENVKDKPTDDFSRVDDAIKRIESSYEKEDLTSFMKGVDSDFDLDYSKLEAEVEDEFDRFDSFDIDIYVDRVSLSTDKKIVFADTHWYQRRVLNATGKEVMRDGRTTFIFRILPSGKLVLKGMKGDRIFGYR